MAASGEVSPLSTETKWGDTAVHLKDFASKHPLPNVIKISKGQYRNIGVAKTVYNELYIHSVRSSKKVLAEGIKLKDGRRSIQTIEQKFSLPLSYQGWFELLSEDGKPIKAILSVQELVKVFPNKCLVRENIKGFLPKESGELTVEKARVVHTGEQMTLMGEISVPFTTPKGVFKKKLLKCMDMKEEPVFFLLEQRGLFSPIAGTGNISGVHNIKGLLEKFRMPIMVRLVHGIIPTRMDKNSFTGVFRLLSLYSDETAFVCPLKRDAKMVPISTREPLKIVAASNLDNIRDLEDSKYFNQRCTRMIASYNNSIHIMVNMPDPVALEKGKQELLQFEKERQRQVQQNRTNGLPTTEENILFEEVDDIYQYVRDGGPPPPPRPRPGQNGTANGGWRLSSKQNKSKTPEKRDKISKKNEKEKKSSIKAKVSPPPVVAAPSPPPIDRSQDEDYWEEPIYDDIEKYHRRKSTDNLLAIGEPVTPDTSPDTNETGTKTVKSSFAAKLAKFANLGAGKDDKVPSPVKESFHNRLNPERSLSMDNNIRDSSGNRSSDGDRYKSSDSLNRLSGSPNQTKSSRDVAEYIKQLNVPVSNLRQMYKSGNQLDNDQEHTGSRTGSYGDPDRIGSSNEDFVDQDMSPLVQTKKVHTNTHNSNDSIQSPVSQSSTESPIGDESKPAEVRVVPNRNIVTVSTPVNINHQGHQGKGQPLPNNAKVNIILPSNPQQTSIVQSQQNIPGSHMVYNRGSNQISITTPTRLPQQRYVAVARVGPENQTQRTGGDNNSKDHYSNGGIGPQKIDTSRGKMQSMYL